MNRSLRIAIADDEPDMQEYYRTILPVLGHVVVAVADTGRELIEKCRDQRPDLVITDIKMPDMDGIDAARRSTAMGQFRSFSSRPHHDDDFIRRPRPTISCAYLVKPIKQADLEPAIAIVMWRFEQFQALAPGDRRPESRRSKIASSIERAKGLLMKNASLDEPEAFRRLQKLASDQNRKLVEIARMILTAEEALQPPRKTDPGQGRRK